MGLVVPSVSLRPSADTQNAIQPTAATIKALVLKAAGSQTDNLLEFQNSSAVAQLSVLANGADFSFDATAGCMLGATGQKVGFLGKAPVVRPAGASAAGIALIVDPNAQAAIAALQAALGATAGLGLVTEPA
jgi:hypothetical protein